MDREATAAHRRLRSPLPATAVSVVAAKPDVAVAVVVSIARVRDSIDPVQL